MSKINCTFHDDKTASMKLYPDGHYHCFGCGKTGQVSELKLADTGGYPFKSAYGYRGMGDHKENVILSVERIYRLPQKQIRGFSLPYDDQGYYLVWPDGKYYVKRMWDADNGSKYKAPFGHKRPLYVPQQTNDPHLLVVEGEFNAKAVAHEQNHYTVVSPGAASSFNNPDLVKMCLNYEAVCIVVDKDAAGWVGGMELKSKLLGKVRCVIYPVEKDFNQTLQDEGYLRVKHMVDHAMGLL